LVECGKRIADACDWCEIGAEGGELSTRKFSVVGTMFAGL
jgi:hypothetical protein